MSTINVTNLRGKGGTSPNLPDGAVITGVVTATSFSGSGANLTGVANTDFVVGTAITMATGNIANVNLTKSAAGAGATVGSFTGVTTYYGDGSNLTGVGETIAPWNYNPDVGDTKVMLNELTTSGIGITFNKKIEAGSGTATLKIVNAGAAGTTIQSWGVSSCTFNVTALILDTLVSNLTLNQTYQVDIPSGFIVDSNETSYAGTAYTFTATGPVSRLFSWGQATQGQRGLNNLVRYSSPTQVGGLGWSVIARTGANHGTYSSFAIKDDGTMWVWGNGGAGSLGLNATTSYSSPVQLGTNTNWGMVSKTYYGALATKTDNTLWSWGYNENSGQLGHNNKTNYSSPTQIPGTTWSTDKGKLFGNRHSSWAIKTNGTLWSWGDNEKGQLGHNNRTDYSSPVQVPGTTWAYVSGNEAAMVAIKTDGTMWSWGENDNAQLGLNQTHNLKLSSPAQIPGTTWRSVASGLQKFHLATRTDGTLWSWGYNAWGQLGQNQGPGNNNADYSSPIQIPGTNWDKVTAGRYNVHATKTDGTLWGWGSGADGALGIPSIGEAGRSSPTQLPGTEWTGDIANDRHGGFAIQVDQTP